MKYKSLKTLIFMIRFFSGFAFYYFFMELWILLTDTGHILPYISNTRYVIIPAMALACIIVWMYDWINMKYLNLSKSYYNKTIGFVSGIALGLLYGEIIGMLIARSM